MTHARRLRFAGVAALAALLLAFVTAPSLVVAAGVQECLECHDDIVKAEDYAKSAHGELVCVSCHFEVNDLKKHENGEITIGDVQCARCHRDVSAAIAASDHRENASCDDCHGAVHTTLKGRGKLAVTTACAACHAEEYLESAHGMALAKGNTDAPSCVDCHEGPHALMALGEDAVSPARRALTNESCVHCHENAAMMAKAGLEATSVEHYEEGYHGKVAKLGYLEDVAGCADCHTAHSVLAATDPKSSVNKANLAATCKGAEARCHPQANENFTKYDPHATHKDKSKFPVLFWTFVAMSGLLIGVFAFFWLHTLLWWQKAFREAREFRGKEHHIDPALALDGVMYKRFGWFPITLHVIVIVSFLGLVFSALPLKFPEAFWAPALMKFWGGAAAAGLAHRWSAAATFFYFLLACGRVFWFLFIMKSDKGFFGRLFGPDSLFPNLDDGRQMVGMFKWFFGMGPRPKFGKWTYWEKFDFLAVFWGMVAIGLTGLMLWVPEWFAKFTPGWFFNIAAIVHADEAMLAAGFIFTVHFFNTHLRPEKFPIDTVVFTGKVSRHEFIEERALQIPLERQNGNLDKMKTGYASALVEFIAMVFGYASLFLGLAGLFLLVTGFFGIGG
jgi:cytochrome b subunit of formate dehydrogenase